MAGAAETTATVYIGGSGSCSSAGFCDPALLDDGVTEASAIYQYTFDDATGALTLEVTNTSPVLPGVPNPVITDVFFNTPLEVTGVTLDAQVGSAGPAPAFALTFDPDTSSNPHPVAAGVFGSFSVGLSITTGVQGAIGNADADTWGPPPGTVVVGPVTFTMTVAGAVSGLTAFDFANTFSGTPPGSKPVPAVAKFQSGGVAGSSAFVGPGMEECFLVVGSGNGGGLWTTPLTNNHTFATEVSDIRRQFGILLASPARMPLDRLFGPMVEGTRHFTYGAPRIPLRTIYAQCLMWNPADYPHRPEQYSYGLEIVLWSDGTLSSTPFGTPSGMLLAARMGVTAEGRRYIEFPFAIGGS